MSLIRPRPSNFTGVDKIVSVCCKAYTMLSNNKDTTTSSEKILHW